LGIELGSQLKNGEGELRKQGPAAPSGHIIEEQYKSNIASKLATLGLTYLARDWMESGGLASAHGIG
jgi:hypothetical protein